MKWVVLFIVAFVLATLLTPVVVPLNVMRHLWRGTSLGRYFKTAAIGFDQAGGSILYSQEDYTISSYTYYLAIYKGNRQAQWFLRFIDFVFGENHCKNSFENEAAKRNIFRKETE
ncbi:hypothetical protein [Hydrogenimonas urashimensis]|uniref:hypothetical protein n=1 Tax=Hydrogenimonas urashimensis TaxID=2740515 RepID=UPI0019155714|nr:hypothetical protein [Hydrogenimonas urashimensis]